MRAPIGTTLAACLLAVALPSISAMSQTIDLNGTSWTLAELPGLSLAADHPATLRFEGGRLHGTDGCNAFTGSYTTDGGGLRVSSGMASTRRACPEPIAKQAGAFTGTLAQVRGARIDGGRLVLLDTGGGVLATLAAQSQELAGTIWQVTGYNNGKQAVVSVLRESTLTIEFAPGGKVGGAAGCNRFSGTYASTGASLTLGELATTRRTCARPDGVMDQEAAYLAALRSVARARLDGNRLELRREDGALAVSATRQDQPR